MADGVDLYTKYQSVNDWQKLRNSGRSFAYFKGTDGMSARNTADWPAQARRVGIACGLYGYAQFGSATDQYDLLLRTAQQRGAMDLSPALDLEDPFVPGRQATDFAIAWLGRALQAGQIPVFYANDSMMGYLLPAVRAMVPEVWPWIARYGARPKNPFRTWQHSSTSQVPGITASGVDENTGEAPILIGSQPAPGPPPATKIKISQLEDSMMDPVIHPPTSGGGIAENMLVHTGAAAVLVVQPLDGDDKSKLCFFGAGGRNDAPVWTYGPGGGKGGGHATPSAAGYLNSDERRLSRNHPGVYDIPAGTTSVYYQYSSEGRTSVQIVPRYLLG